MSRALCKVTSTASTTRRSATPLPRKNDSALAENRAGVSGDSTEDCSAGETSAAPDFVAGFSGNSGDTLAPAMLSAGWCAELGEEVDAQMATRIDAVVPDIARC